MDIFLSLGLGSILKIYDDIGDLNIKIPETANELLKMFQIGLFTLLAHNDFSFSIIVFGTLLASAFAGGNDLPFWKSLVFFTLFMSLISIKLENNIFKRLFLAACIIFSTYFEALSFPEETSVKKTIFRISICVILLLLQTISFFRVPFYTKFSFFAIGYFTTSLLLRHVCYTDTESKEDTVVSETSVTPDISDDKTSTSDSSETHTPESLPENTEETKNVAEKESV